MAEQHIQLLTTLGLPKEQIDALEALTPETMKEWKPDDMVSAVQTNVKNTLSNDATFLASIPKEKISPAILKEIEKGQYARFQNELVEVATKKLGLEDKDLTEDDRKSIKGLAEKMATSYLAKNGKGEGLKDMQTKLSEALQGLETLKTQHTENLKTELEKINGANTAKLIKTLAKVELQGLENVKLAVAAGFISDPALAALSSKYAVVMDANDNLDIKQKDNVALDVLDKGGKKITFSQALKEVVIEHKLGSEVVADPLDPKKKKIIVDGGGDGGEGGFQVPSYIAEKINSNGDLK